jgi:hypothetical protein
MIKTALQRRRARTIALLLNLHAWQMLYAGIRPMATRFLTLPQLKTLLKAGLTITLDCSEAITLIFRLAGFQDPNGCGYNGTGYTGTMLEHLRHFSDWSQVHVGTIIVIGGGTGEHAVMVTKPNGDNPMVFTHGSHAKAAIWDFKTEMTYHVGQPYTLLAVDNL